MSQELPWWEKASVARLLAKHIEAATGVPQDAVAIRVQLEREIQECQTKKNLRQKSQP